MERIYSLPLGNIFFLTYSCLSFADKNIKVSKAVEIDQSLRNKIESLESDIDNYERDLSDAENEKNQLKIDLEQMGKEMEALQFETNEVGKMVENTMKEKEIVEQESGKIKLSFG